MYTPEVNGRPIHQIHKLMDEVVETSYDVVTKEVDFTKLIDLIHAQDVAENVSWEKIFHDRRTHYSPSLTEDDLDRLNTILARYIEQPKLEAPIELKNSVVQLKEFIDENKHQLCKSPFESLPTEMLFNIFGFLNPKQEEQNADELHAMLTCRQICTVIGAIRGIRRLKKGIEKALGNLLKNVQPDTRILKHIGNNIFSIAKDDMNTAVKEIGPVLARTSYKPYSFQNHIITTLIEAWIEQCNLDATDGKDSKKTLTDLLKALYQHHLCNEANKIHIANLANKGGILSGYEKEIQSWNTPFREGSLDGIVLSSDSSFQRKPVDENIIPTLIISGQNTFKLGEIVAVNRKGSLIGKRKKLWYGVVREITKSPEGETLYRVYTQLYENDGKKCWIYDGFAASGVLGKITRTPRNIEIIGKSYEIKKHNEDDTSPIPPDFKLVTTELDEALHEKIQVRA